MFHLLSYRHILLFLSVPLLNSCTTSSEVVRRQGKVRSNNDEQRSLRGSRGEPECDGNNTQCYMISKDHDCKCKAVDQEKYYEEFMTDDGGGRRGDREPACNNTCQQLNAEPYCDLEKGECLLSLNGGTDFTKEIEVEIIAEASTSMISGCETSDDCVVISKDHYCECKAADKKKYAEYMEELMEDPQDPKPGCDKTCEQLEAEPYCEEGKCLLSLDNGTEFKRNIELDPEKITTLSKTKKCREDEDCIVAVDRCEGCNCIAVHRKDEEEALECDGTLMTCPEEPCWTGETHMTASCKDGECYLNV